MIQKISHSNQLSKYLSKSFINTIHQLGIYLDGNNIQIRNIPFNDLSNIIKTLKESPSYRKDLIGLIEFLFSSDSEDFIVLGQTISTCLFKSSNFFILKSKYYEKYKIEIDEFLDKEIKNKQLSNIDDTFTSPPNIEDKKLRFNLRFIQQAIRILKSGNSNEIHKHKINFTYIWENINEILERTPIRSMKVYACTFYDIILSETSIDNQEMKYEIISQLFIYILKHFEQLESLFPIIKSIFNFKTAFLENTENQVEIIVESSIKICHLINCILQSFLKLEDGSEERLILFDIVEKKIISIMKKVNNKRLILDKIISIKLLELFKTMLFHIK